jgi:ADP-ribosylglycohydrolase
VPLALAAFLFAGGVPEAAIPLAVMIGRDCDTTATTVGSWCGALHGEQGLPAEWVNTVCTVNEPEIDIRGLAEDLYRITEEER